MDPGANYEYQTRNFDSATMGEASRKAGELTKERLSPGELKIENSRV